MISGKNMLLIVMVFIVE